MSTKTMLRGAFTVDAPRKRLRAWVGIPVLFGASIPSTLVLKGTVKNLVTSDRPVAAAAVAVAIPAAVGAAMLAHPYTRWAGVLVLGWMGVSFAANAYLNGTQTVKDAYAAMAGAPPVQILGGH